MSYAEESYRRKENQEWQETTLCNENLKAIYDVLSNQKPQTQSDDEGTETED